MSALPAIRAGMPEPSHSPAPACEEVSGITAACKCGRFQQPRLRACASSQHATHAALAAHITAPQPLKHQLVSPLSHFHCACQLHVCSNSCPLCRIAEAPPACCWCPQSRLQHQAERCPTSLSTRSSSCPRLGCIEFHWGPSAKAQVRSTVRPSCSDSLRSTMRNDYLQTPHHIQRALPEPVACSAGEYNTHRFQRHMHTAGRGLDSARDQKAGSYCMAGMAVQAG